MPKSRSSLRSDNIIVTLTASAFVGAVFVLPKAKLAANCHCADCRKTYIIFKNGVWGVAPMRVVSRWCRCIVQRLCATDCKRPCLVRAAAPHSAPARTPGVYAQKLCTMQSQPSIHSLSPGKGVFGKDAEIRTHQALHEAKPTECPKGDRD